MRSQKTIEITNSGVLDQEVLNEIMRANLEHIYSHLPELFIASTIGALCVLIVRYIVPEKAWDGIKLKKLYIWILSGIIFALCFIGYLNYIEKNDHLEERLKIVRKDHLASQNLTQK